MRTDLSPETVPARSTWARRLLTGAGVLLLGVTALAAPATALADDDWDDDGGYYGEAAWDDDGYWGVPWGWWTGWDDDGWDDDDWGDDDWDDD